MHLAELAATLTGYARPRPIDSELRLIAGVRRTIREHGGEPSSRNVDELLDERLAHRGRAGKEHGSRGVAVAQKPSQRSPGGSSLYGRPEPSAAGDPQGSIRIEPVTTRAALRRPGH